MLPVTPRMSSRPASVTRRSAPGRGLRRGRGRLLLALGVHLADDHLLERDARPLLPPGLDLGGGAPVELAAPLRGEDDEEVAVRDALEALLQRGERHE